MKLYLPLCLTFLISLHSLQGWQQSIPAFKPSSFQALKPCKLQYSLSWNGALKAGTLYFDFGKKDKRYPQSFITQAYGKSIGPAALLFPYQFNITSFTSNKHYQPAVSVAFEDDGTEQNTITNSFKPSGVLSTEKSTLIKKKRTSTTRRSFSYTNSHDAISAMLYIRGRKLQKGDQINLCIHPFKSPYYANITVLGRETHRKRQCIKLDIKLRKIDPKTLKLKTYKKMKSATLWISDDPYRIPIELRSEVFIGDIRAVLTSSKPL